MLHQIRPAIQFVRNNSRKVIWAEFNKKDAHPFLQFVKYAICGVAAFACHQVIWLVISILFFPSLDSALPQEVRATNSAISNCIAVLFSTAVAYALNVLWVFTPGRHSRSAEVFYFFAISCASFAGGLLAGPWLIHQFGINTLIAQLSMAVTSMLINYACRKFFIFKH